MQKKALAPVPVLIETELGEIEVLLEPAKTPITCENFLRYVQEGAYDGGRFHRTVKPDNQPNNDVKIEVIQAGPRPGAALHAPIPLERTLQSKLTHRDGAISMARTTPDSAVADFFICIGDQPSLDYTGARNPDGQGFAAFGRVIRGMDVVRRIQLAPCEAQRLTPPVAIRRIRRKD
jgi:peptidyl-prolyl cis-trans isomerase A (cyclophilin A)